MTRARNAKGRTLTTDPRSRARRRPGGAIVVVAVLLTVAAAVAAVLPATATAEGSGTYGDSAGERSVIEVGGDAVVRPGSVVNQVYAVGGDAVIGGVVLRDVVCVGGDVRLAPTAVVQENVVCIGGRVVRDPGSEVLGDVTVVSPGSLRSLTGWNPISPAVDPFSAGALLSWAVSLLAYVGLAAAVAAAVPKTVVAATARIDRHPWVSLAAGLLAALVVVPLISVVLLVSVIGVPLLVPWLVVVVPVALIVAFVAVSVTIGRLVLTAARRGSAGLAVQAATGALLLSLARLVPYAGATAWLVAWTLGFGAVSVALAIWLRDRRVRRRSRAGPTTNPT
jgi:hypothetical protein